MNDALILHADHIHVPLKGNRGLRFKASGSVLTDDDVAGLVFDVFKIMLFGEGDEVGLHACLVAGFPGDG